MTELFVAKISQFPDGERRIVAHKGREIGVFHWQGKFYAYENLCVHQRGPACEGIIMHRLRTSLVPIAAGLGKSFPTTRSTSCARGMATNTISRPANASPIAV